MDQDTKPLDEYNSCTDAIGVIRMLYLEGTLEEDKAREMIGTCLWGPEPGSLYNALLSIQVDYDNYKITEDRASTLVAELIAAICPVQTTSLAPTKTTEHQSQSI